MIKNTLKFTVIGIFVFLFALSASAQTANNTPYDNDVHTLLTLNKTKESMETTIPLMMQQFKAMRPDIPTNVWSSMEKEMKGEGLNDLIEKMIPMYKKHFTHEEVKQLISFYKSPIGAKMAEKTPVLTQESYEIGKQWGQELGQKVALKLKKAGY